MAELKGMRKNLEHSNTLAWKTPIIHKHMCQSKETLFMLLCMILIKLYTMYSLNLITLTDINYMYIMKSKNNWGGAEIPHVCVYLFSTLCT